jgi:hypothetical protein
MRKRLIELSKTGRLLRPARIAVLIALVFNMNSSWLLLASMRALLVKFLPLALPLCGPAHAEGGCPPGQMPSKAWAPAGSAESLASCVPIPYQAQTPAWESRWGAVATDNKGKFGIVTGQKTERLARKAALAKCKQRGASACTADFTFRNNVQSWSRPRRPLSHRAHLRRRRPSHSRCPSAFPATLANAGFTTADAAFLSEFVEMA